MASPPVSHLPPDLFQSRDVFASVLRDGWDLLSASKRNELMKKFAPESLNYSEQEESVRMLLRDDLTKFDTNPLDSMYFQLKISRLAPDINKTLEDVKRLKLTAQRLKEKENQIILWKEVLSRRKQLLCGSISCSPDEPLAARTRLKRKSLSALPHVPLPADQVCMQSVRLTEKTIRSADRRYKQELKELNSLTVITSDDDEDLIFESEDGEHFYDDIACHPFQKDFNLKNRPEKTDDMRYKKLLSDYRQKNKHRRKEGVKKEIPNSNDKSENRQFSDQLNAIISRVGGAADDMVMLASPPISPLGVNKTKKRKPVNAAVKRKASSKADKLIKKEPLSPVPESKPLLPGIELMSRKLDLNLNGLKKEHKTVDVFDFHDDSPSESLAPETIPVLPVQSPAAAAKIPFEPVLPHQQVPQVLQTAASSQTQPSVIPTTSPQQLATVSTKILQQSAPRLPQAAVSNHISPQVQQSVQFTAHQVQTVMQSSHVQASITMQPQTHIQTYLQTPQSVQSQANLLSQIQAHPVSDAMTVPVVQTVVKTKTPPPVVYEEPPASFFALIRDVFKAYSQPDFKLTLHKLEELVKDRVRNINPSLGWNHESVQSAMNFLSYFTDPNPEVDSIPLVDYKEKNQQWQWIGQDRDSDDVLSLMCKEWLNEKDRNSSVIDPSQPIPPAAWPTEWTVQPSTDDERKEYREQEAVRYNNPNKAFTYRVHSYESVVGPVKGCGVAVTAAPTASPNKAREHSLLVSDRPPFVTLLSLVRDAAARLPNGEGTRADICELLKDSQYLLPSVSDQQINSIVSGALDRLHYEKDPCVKYDVNRKVWIYLHRNRSEGDFERLHEMQIAAAKAKKNLCKSQRKPPRQPQVSPPTTTCPKQIQQKKPLVVVDSSIVSPITSTGQTRISISPLIQNCHATQDSTDKTILNILNQAQGTGPPIYPKKKLVKEVQIVHNIPAGDDDSGVTSTIASVRPVSANNVVSMLPVAPIPAGNRLIASADTKDKVQRIVQQSSNNGLQPLQKLSSKSAITVLPARQVVAGPNDENKRTVTVGNPPTHSKVQQPLVRQIPNQLVTTQPVTCQQTISIQPATQGTQITVPSSMIFGARHGQVLLGMFARTDF